MIVAAHQAEYLPSIDFFAKMLQADVFILADDVQYTKHSRINRAKIKNSEGWQWLSVPVLSKGRIGQSIGEVEINPRENWCRRHWTSIFVNYRHAGYFELWAEALGPIYARRWTRLIDINRTLIDLSRSALDVSVPLRLSSEFEAPASGTERLVGLIQATGGDTYLAGPEAKRYLVESKFRAAGIELRYLEFRQPTYHQLFGPFVPDLSILDLVMNEGERSREIVIGACAGERAG